MTKHATTNGELIYASGETNIDSNTFTNNEANNGGAIYPESTATLTLMTLNLTKHQLQLTAAICANGETNIDSNTLQTTTPLTVEYLQQIH